MNTKKVYLDGSVQIGGGKSINDIEQTAENAMKAAALAKNMTLQLSNEYQGISVDSNGNYGTFPSGVTTQAVVMYGTQDITADCSYTISKSDGVDGAWDISTKTYESDVRMKSPDAADNCFCTKARRRATFSCSVMADVVFP